MVDQLSRVFAALADPTRRDMVARLTDADATVTELAAPYDVSLQAVSKHLKVLEDAGLVAARRDQQRRPVHLEAEVFDLMTKWIERYRRAGRGALPPPRRRPRPDGRRRHLTPEHPEHPTPSNERSRVMSNLATHPQATIEADPTVPAIHITREFRATKAQLIRAHTDPEIFATWIGPHDLETRIDHWDARSGGSFRFTNIRQGDAGVEEYSFRGCFHEIGDRLVQTFTWEGMPEGVSLETMTFEELGDGRTRLHATSLCGSFEDRDGWLRSGMETGVNDGYEKLDDLLAAGSVD